MCTPVNPSFTIQKWGLRGSNLYWYMFVMSEPAHDTTYHKTCVTKKDSDQQVHLAGIARIFVYPSLDSLAAVESVCNQ